MLNVTDRKLCWFDSEKNNFHGVESVDFTRKGGRPFWMVFGDVHRFLIGLTRTSQCHTAVAGRNHKFGMNNFHYCLKSAHAKIWSGNIPDVIFFRINPCRYTEVTDFAIRYFCKTHGICWFYLHWSKYLLGFRAFCRIFLNIFTKSWTPKSANSQVGDRKDERW